MTSRAEVARLRSQIPDAPVHGLHARCATRYITTPHLLGFPTKVILSSLSLTFYYHTF